MGSKLFSTACLRHDRNLSAQVSSDLAGGLLAYIPISPHKSKELTAPATLPPISEDRPEYCLQDRLTIGLPAPQKATDLEDLFDTADGLSV